MKKHISKANKAMNTDVKMLAHFYAGYAGYDLNDGTRIQGIFKI
jgi:hypothetical protein